MKLGDMVQWSWWLTGCETGDDLVAYAREIRNAMDETEEAENVRFGPAETITLRPGDPHVPSVPDYIHGPDVRLLVTEAKAVRWRMKVKPALPGFVHDLDPDDHALLRRITRKKYIEEFPQYPVPTDRQCDTLINDLGPDVAVETLKTVSRSDLI